MEQTMYKIYEYDMSNKRENLHHTNIGKVMERSMRDAWKSDKENGNKMI